MMIGAALLRYGDASNFEISDSLLRPTPSSNQVLVNIHSSSVNPIDLMKREGYGKAIFEKQRRSNFPWVLGSDFSGTVSEVGSKVTKFKEGDEVWGCTADANHGTYAEYGVFDLEELEHKPVNLSFNEAASLPYVALTTWAGVIRWAGLRPQDIANKKVLIQAGSGGVGTFAIQLFKLWGAEVATTCSKKNHELVKKLGADVVIDYTSEDFVEVLNDYDIVLDSVGDLAGETEIERCSGRMPMVFAPNLTASDPSSKFIEGEPMKPATKTFLGLLYNSSGLPTCSILPAFSTTIRSAIVMAST